MKYLNKTVWCFCLPALLFGGCDSGKEEIPYRENPVAVRFSVAEDSFVQTRADLIGKDGTGPQYGTIYIRQTPKEDQNTHMWGHYRVTEGQSGSLTLEDKEHLYWLDSETEYFFEAISVPVNGNDIERSGDVTFTDEMPYESGGQGEVTFGGYDTGLEYFVGVTVGPQKLSNGQTVTMSMARQIGKIIFKTIKYKNASDVENENVEECRIIFPNLPTKATFDLDRMYRVNQVTMDPQPLGTNGRNYLCLTDSDEKGIKMTWKKALYPKPTHLTEDEHNSKTQAIYLPTFMFWDGKDNKPENQSGFFIIQYKDRTYTGNLNVKTLGTNDYIRLWPGDCLRVIVTLQDGPAVGGGDGSAIAEWSIAAEQEVPHYPLPGIYTAEDAQELFAALQSGKVIPERFYKEENGKKVIRLFTNIDWSMVTTELIIPDEFVFVGQGYNVRLGEGGSISGAMEGLLYINGKRYEDGVLADALRKSGTYKKHDSVC